MNTRKELKFYALLMAFAIIVGAFGAHYFESRLSIKALKTFKTGNLYHFFGVFSLFLFLVFEKQFNLNLKIPKYLALGSLTIFSGGCYLYAITGIKFFAMIVPFGGLSFIASWIITAKKA